jgi:hypothetical protein
LCWDRWPGRDNRGPPVGRDTGRRHALRLRCRRLSSHVTADPRPRHPYVVRGRRVPGAVDDGVLNHVQREFSPDARLRWSELLYGGVVRSQPRINRPSTLVGPNFSSPGEPAALDLLHAARLAIARANEASDAASFSDHGRVRSGAGAHAFRTAGARQSHDRRTGSACEGCPHGPMHRWCARTRLRNREGHELLRKPRRLRLHGDGPGCLLLKGGQT